MVINHLMYFSYEITFKLTISFSLKQEELKTSSNIKFNDSVLNFFKF